MICVPSSTNLLPFKRTLQIALRSISNRWYQHAIVRFQISDFRLQMAIKLATCDLVRLTLHLTPHTLHLTPHTSHLLSLLVLGLVLFVQTCVLARKIYLPALNIGLQNLRGCFQYVAVSNDQRGILANR